MSQQNPVQHLRVKIFAQEPVMADLADAIPVFHRWIQNRVREEILIDVADYRHVPSGPGVMLIGHEANYSLDNAGNRLGLLYNRKVASEGSAQDNLLQAMTAAREACRQLEQEAEFKGKLRFDTNECEISINDRLLAPNTVQTYEAVRPELERLFDGLWGQGTYLMEWKGSTKELFRIAARAR